MFPALAAAIPFLMSLFSSSGAATAGAAGAATAAGTAGAAGGAGAGGLGGLLGGLFGGASGAGGAGGIFGNIMGAGGAAEAPVQLSGPGMEGAAAAAPSVGQGGAASGGGGIFGNLLGGGGSGGSGSSNNQNPLGQIPIIGGLLNMVNEIGGGPGRAYMVGAQAGKGDFKGAQQMMDQHDQVVNQTNRTGLLANEDKRRQVEFDTNQAQAAKIQAAQSKIAGIFEDPKALNDLPGTMAKILPHMLSMGDHAGAHDVLALITKTATDKKTDAAMGVASSIVRDNTDKDGNPDFAKINSGIEAIGSPEVRKAYQAIQPSLVAQANVANQKGIRAEAAVREDQANKRLDISERNSDLSARRTDAMISNMAATQDRLSRQMDMKQGLGPVPPKQLTEYINKNGANPQQDPVLSNQPSVTHGDLVQSGYNRVPQAVQTQLKQSNIALTQLNRLEGMTDDLFKDVKPGMNLLNAAKLKGQEALATGKVREFQTLLLETIPSMAVASGLTPGRVGEAVLERIEKPMMPNLSDSQETAKGKLKQLKLRLENNRDMFFGQGAKLEGPGAGGATPSKAEIDAAKKRLGL